MITKFFPTLQIGICLLSCLVYVLAGDYRRGIYWFSAAMLTASVTY